MKKVKIGRKAIFDSQTSELQPNTYYLLADEVVRSIYESDRYSGYELLAECEDFPLTNWHYPRGIQSLLIWNTGRLGDELWTTAVVRQIKKLLPDCAINVVSRNTQLWYGNRDISCIRTAPVRPEDLEQYDAYLIYDETVSKLVRYDQPNCYQVLFEEARLPFTKEAAKPYMKLFRDDELTAINLAMRPDENGDLWESSLHCVIGLHSTSQSRNIPISRLVEFAKALDAKYAWLDGFVIYGLSDDGRGAKMQDAFEGIKSYVPVHSKLRIREIAALVRKAMCVVSPDSMLVHMAAAFDTPCVALMTTVSPEHRVSTYEYCVPIYKGQACKYAPCSWKHNKFITDHGPELDIAPCYTPNRDWCDVATAINANDIMAAYEQAVHRKMSKDAKYRDGEFATLAMI